MKRKNLFSMMVMMMTVMLSVGFASCSSDDDVSVSGFSLEGTWYVYESDVDGLDSIIQFFDETEGTGVWTYYYDGGIDDEDMFTFKFSGNTIKIWFDEEEDAADPMVLKIKIKSAKEFTWTDGHDTLTFKKKD